MKKWKQWVDKLVPLHGTIWKNACIYDAIMGSTYEVRKCENAVLGLAEFWCPGTNTFVFPWGEATVTLEDVLILVGFSVLGQPVTSPPDRNMVEINERITEEHTLFWQHHSAHKPECSAWLNHFMELEDIDRNIEHVGFLALWLSRYVFPKHPQDIVDKNVFSIAIHLAQGTRIALAPAVLSSLYRDLGLLTRNASNNVYEVWGPFHIVQMWVWEHFPLLRPAPNSLGEGEPRVARWNKSSSSLELTSVRNVMKLSENFQWRCYTRHESNWQHPSFYKEKEMWVVYDSNIDDELRSFARCLRASELVGIDCIEQYLSDRVAMQFGLDQALPGYFTRADSKRENVWITYDKSIKKAEFYIPPRLFESDVTTRYLDWWKQSLRKRRGGDNAKKNLQPTRVESKRKEVMNSVSPRSPFMDKRHKLQEKESNVCRDTQTRWPSLHSTISKEAEKKIRSFSTTVTKKAIRNKGSKNADSGKNGKTAGTTGLESRVLNLERGVAEIKAILKNLKEDEA